MTKIRLDQWLVNNNYFVSRSKARDAILQGQVTSPLTLDIKPSLKVDDSFEVEIDANSQLYVSRAAYKLLAAIERFSPVIKDKIFLDIGASTGGFSQILLEHGAKHIIAVDVGHDQFAPILRQDERITLLEGLNARYLDATHVPNKVDGVVADVSFISLKLALPPALSFVKEGGFAILLVKPQFEGGKEALNKQGIVSCPKKLAEITEDLSSWLKQQDNWNNVAIHPSPLKGKDGNQEFLLYGEKNVSNN